MILFGGVIDNLAWSKKTYFRNVYCDVGLKLTNSTISVLLFVEHVDIVIICMYLYVFTLTKKLDQSV